ADHPNDVLLQATVAMDSLVPDPEPDGAEPDVAHAALPEPDPEEPDGGQHHGAEPEIGPPDGEVSDAEPATPVPDDVLAHRANDFAEAFLAGETATIPGDDYTFEHEVVDPEELAALAERDGDPGEDEAHFRATHLGGVATLPSAEPIDVRISADGLDLLQADGTIVGRLGWPDISALEVTVPHGRRRRRGAPRLIVHTAGGSARFEISELSGEELQDRVQPLMARYGH
ncbi:MAG TPA: hypothetical protein VFN48_02875, partial [Solirubrobacteraceae bacterium]|nr:hypothetical protein [Solirubrobacteraceae bacterium]